MNRLKLLFAACVAVAGIAAPLCANADDATLTVHTYRAPGICPACDAARPVTARLATLYPFEFVYADDPTGAVRRRADRVDRFPTFILTLRDVEGETREIVRWSGAQELERRVRNVFRAVGVAPASGRFAPRPTAP